MEHDTIDQEIRQAQSRVSQLATRRDELREKFEAQQRRAAWLSHYSEQERKLEQEIASLEGRPYRDENNPDYEYPEPPEPPDE
jgi:Tfp pilus assembly protein PilO